MKIGTAFIVAATCVLLPLSALADIVAVEGRVYDPRNGAPIAAAEVTIVDASGAMHDVSTDKRGRYRALGIVPGEVNIRIAVPPSRHRFYTNPCMAPLLGTLREDIEFVETSFMSPPGSSYDSQPLSTSCAVEPRTEDVYLIH